MAYYDDGDMDPEAVEALMDNEEEEETGDGDDSGEEEKEETE